ADTIIRPDGRGQSTMNNVSHDNQRITPSLRDLLQNPIRIHEHTIIGQDERIQTSRNNQRMTPSFTDMLQNSVRIHANIIIRQDGRVQSYCGLRLTETATNYSGINPLPFPDTTRLNSTDIAGPSTSKVASTRLPRRSAGPTHLRRAKKGTQKAAFTSAEREEKSKTAVNKEKKSQGGKVLLPRFHDTPTPLNHLLSHDQPSTAKFRDKIRVYNSMFCFTSFGAKIDHSINTRRAPYTFRINGQNYHRMGSLLPKEGMPPKFA
ncbi:hypothetical protein Tco_1495736, partial [Tanacetum coccineum]